MVHRAEGESPALLRAMAQAVAGESRALLLVASAGVLQLKANGVPQTDVILTASNAVDGQDALARHFDAGSGTVLHRFEAVEAELRERQTEPAGPIRLAATFGFGRLWLGPALADFQSRYPAVDIQLQLTEHLPDLAVDGFDGAIWLWSAPGERAAEWVSRRLAANQRVLVAAPRYLNARGTPHALRDLTGHACLVVRENGDGPGQRFDHWRLQCEGEGEAVVQHTLVRGPLSSNSGEMVRDWCLAGHGIMLRSLWDIAPQLQSGALVRVLPAYAMPGADIHWLAPYRAQVPRRIRLLVEFLAESFSHEPWKLKPVWPAAPPG